VLAQCRAFKKARYAVVAVYFFCPDIIFSQNETGPCLRSKKESRKVGKKVRKKERKKETKSEREKERKREREKRSITDNNTFRRCV